MPKHTETHTFSSHTHKLFYSLSPTQHGGLGGISWVEDFQKNCIILEPCCEETAVLLFYRAHTPVPRSWFPISILSLLSFTSGGCVSAFHQCPLPIQLQQSHDCAGWQTSAHQALNDWHLQIFFLFFVFFFFFWGGIHLTQSLGLHAPCVCKPRIFTLLCYGNRP